MTMTLREYVLLVLTKIEEAQAAGNRDEVYRLLCHLADSVMEQAGKVLRG